MLAVNALLQIASRIVIGGLCLSAKADSAHIECVLFIKVVAAMATGMHARCWCVLLKLMLSGTVA